MNARLRTFGRFWYDFVVGDDWQLALGVVAALAITYGISRSDQHVWWIVAVAAALLLAASLWRATRDQHRE